MQFNLAVSNFPIARITSSGPVPSKLFGKTNKVASAIRNRHTELFWALRERKDI
jgi:hypothetical protein